MLSEDQWALIFAAAKARGSKWADLNDVNAFKSEILAALSTATPAPIAPTPAIALSNSMSKWQAMIDVPLLKLAFPANKPAELVKWVEPTRNAVVQWGVDLPREIASFLANMNVESNGLTVLTENLNYSSAALIQMFGRHRISVADANRYGRNASHPASQEVLANILYGGEWGRKNLGNTEPGDGWRFKGYGPKQLTGRGNQTAFGTAMGMTVDQVPDYVRTREGGMMSAGWFWKTKNMDAKAATPGIEDDRIAINGGTFGLALVQTGFAAILTELLEREKS